MKRKRISLKEALMVFTKEEMAKAKKNYPHSRLTFWYDCGMTYATVNGFGGTQITVLKDGMWMGQD